METKYNIVKQSIKSRILNGTFQPNQKISSESELMKEFNVSRHTVRLAIGDLVNQGYLYREQGAGTFCADRSIVAERSNGGNQKNIALVTTYISDYIFPSIIRGAESYLSKQGYHVSLFSTDNDPENEKRILEKILSQQFDGVIVEPTKSAYFNQNIKYYLNLERVNIPYIMINAYYDELEPLSITVDDEMGGFLLTEHLINLGHRNIIGFFKTDDLQGTRRMKGYLKAFRNHQVPINSSHLISYSTDEKNTKPIEALNQLLSQPTSEKITAIVCYNDELAMKLLDVIRSYNLKIPDDLSIVGFDNSFLADVSEVKLTTIDHPKSDMGEEAAKMILKLIKEKKEGQRKCNGNISSFVYEPKLITRTSTKEYKTGE